MKINNYTDERALRVALSKKSKAVLVELLIQKIYECRFLEEKYKGKNKNGKRD